MEAHVTSAPPACGYCGDCPVCDAMFFPAPWGWTVFTWEDFGAATVARFLALESDGHKRRAPPEATDRAFAFLVFVMLATTAAMAILETEGRD